VRADAPHLIRPTVALVDIDDNVHQTYGYAKQGTGRGYTGLNGLNQSLEERGDRAIGDGNGRGDLGSGRPGRRSAKGIPALRLGSPSSLRGTRMEPRARVCLRLDEDITSRIIALERCRALLTNQRSPISSQH
jgi:hypothetical protein